MKAMETEPLRLTVAVRCFVLPRRVRRAFQKLVPRGWRSSPLSARVLVFDAETTTEAYQNFLIGSFQISVFHLGKYTCVQQGVIVGDALSKAEIQIVEAYARARRLRAYSRDEFVRNIFLPEVYDLGTLCVGFNLPFDISRVAIRWAPGRKRWRDGFTLYLTESKWVPAIHVKSLDNKRAFIEFTSYRGYQGHEARGHNVFPGRFLDLRTLAFALTGEGHNLQSACQTFGVEHGKAEVEIHGELSPAYLDYNRQDVQATWELYLRLVDEWNQHPFARVPTHAEVTRDPDALLIIHAYSPASLGKAYLRAMGIRPRLARQPRFSKTILGRAMVAYFGGRSECHIRRQIVPVTYLDVLSMYPTVCALMGLWRLVIAREVEVEDATREAQASLETLTLEDLYRPETWHHLAVLVEVHPEDDILPVRAQYLEGGDYQIGLPVVTAGKGARLYYMLADLVASRLLTGKMPRIRRAWRFRAVGIQPGLRPVKLLGEVEMDPRHQDFFRVLIEKRREVQEAQQRANDMGDKARVDYLDSLQHGLKIVANAMYGIFAEVDEKVTGAREAHVYGLRHSVNPIVREEHPGPYAFPPLAALITSGARLMLAMLEVELAQRGVTYAFCDTDSIAIVGSTEVVQAIRERFAALTPYAFGGDLLKLEPENIPDPRATKARQLYCFVISAKRYVLFNVGDDGSIIIRKVSEHGLGHLLSPLQGQDRKWMEQAWAAIIQWARGEGKGLGAGLTFVDLPALGRFPITKPSILKRFTYLNTGIDPKSKKRVQRPYSRQVKPFNFMLVAFPDTGDVTTGGEAYWNDREGPPGAERLPIRPIGPYESDSRKWRRLPWVDLHTGKPVRLTWAREASGLVTRAIRVQTYRDVLRRYVTHPEAKAAGLDGEPCGPHTTGELSRLHAHIERTVHVGKESHELEEVQAGLTLPDATYVRYVDEHVEWKKVRQILKTAPRAQLAKMSGLHVRSIKAILNTSRIPHSQHRSFLREIAQRLVYGIEEQGRRTRKSFLASLPWILSR